MAIHAVVPVKSLARAKSRLAGRLSLDERRNLVVEMLGRVLATLLGCRGVALADVWVISADSEVLALAGSVGARTILDSADDLNGALEQARVFLTTAGVAAMLVIPADVPLIAPADVFALVDALMGGGDLALVTDRQGNGTNALGMRLPSALPFRFGEQSADLHRESAAALGLHLQIYTSPTLSLDVDDSESLGRYRELACANRTSQ